MYDSLTAKQFCGAKLERTNEKMIVSASKDVERLFIFDLTGSCLVVDFTLFLVFRLTEDGVIVKKEFCYCGSSPSAKYPILVIENVGQLYYIRLHEQ